MSEAKHTKGPWRVDTTKVFGAYGVWTDYETHPGHDGAGYPSQICGMFTVSFPQTDAATRPERDANAALIAAAPDLLAACEAWLAYLDPSDNVYSEAETAMIRQMQAAVAKAKETA